MKAFTTIALSLIFATTAFAQNVAIGYPTDGISVTPGSQLTVEIDRPDTLSGSQEVAVVIGMESCAASPCRAPSDGLWTILYNGGYNPQFQTGQPNHKPPHQNFTVTIPQSMSKGKAQLNVMHVSLIGAALAPFLETMNTTLIVL